MENKYVKKGTTPLTICDNCQQEISSRAERCPKCNIVITTACGICKKTIPVNTKTCPECGDPNPFESIREMEIVKESPQQCHHQAYNKESRTHKGHEQNSQNEGAKTIRVGKIGKIGFIILIISVCIITLSPTNSYKSLSIWAGFGMIGGFCMLCAGLIDFAIKFLSKKSKFSP